MNILANSVSAERDANAQNAIDNVMKIGLILLTFLSLSSEIVDTGNVNDITIHGSVKTVYAQKVNIDIKYPSDLETRSAKENTNEPGRAGSIMAINFYVEEKGVQLTEVLFHSEKSCTKFYELVKNSEPEGDFFDEYWYSPSEFIKQKQAFERKIGYGKFDFIKYNGVEFLYNCEPSSGETFGECIIFKNNIRILTTLGSMQECNDVAEQMKSLFSKLKFEKHKL